MKLDLGAPRSLGRYSFDACREQDLARSLQDRESLKGHLDASIRARLYDSIRTLRNPLIHLLSLRNQPLI